MITAKFSDLWEGDVVKWEETLKRKKLFKSCTRWYFDVLRKFYLVGEESDLPNNIIAHYQSKEYAEGRKEEGLTALRTRLEALERWGRGVTAFLDSFIFYDGDVGDADALFDQARTLGLMEE